jgi:two-component system, OmpR family, KDP operon response regulator KdpE
MMSNVRVLVADDDPLLLESVADALISLGADVIRASTGEELVEQLANEGPFDLVVTDVGMPWMSGLTAIHAARSAGISQAVIVMTAREDEGIPAQVQALGPDAVFLRKPFGLTELAAAASALLARRHVPAGQKDV